MDKDKPKIIRRPEVLKKFNAESILALERGLLGDLPEKLKPKPPEPVRGRPNDLQLVSKPPGLLSSCLPVIMVDTPTSAPLTPSDPMDDGVSPLKKSFSFRDKISRMSFFGNKEKQDRTKWKTIEEDEKKSGEINSPKTEKSQAEQDYKSSKRFWFFRNKELVESKKHTRPIYKRSKSFEFLPRASEDEDECFKNPKKELTKIQSYVFGSNDTMGDAWTSNESLEYISNVYYDNEDTVFLKSIKEFPSELSSANNSSISTATSESSGLVVDIFKRESVQNLIEEFDKAVDMFSENYLSDCEPYTKPNKEQTKQGKRRSSSYDTLHLKLQSPKIVPMSKVNELSEDFKKELSKALEVKREFVGRSPTARRGSVTDWFVLEDQHAENSVRHKQHVENSVVHKQQTEVNKYRRAQKKPINRVRRISSTKYWISPEESVVYSREVRPPLVIPVIPRITQYRAPRRDQRLPSASYEDYEPKPITVKSSVRQYERLHDWSPTSERTRMEVERGFSRATDSPPFPRLQKKLSGSSENLLVCRRPNHLQLPASSSGDSLDIEVRESTESGRARKSKSMVAAKRGLRSPVPAPRMLPPEVLIEGAVSVVHEGPVKRTKFFENGKKSRKNWLECYMVLTQTALYFYKDQRTYYASKMLKPPGTPPSPTAPRAELVLPLRNAHVIECIQTHTRRYARSLELTVNHDRYLLQDESEEGAKRWLMYIRSIIYKLGPPTDENLSAQFQSSNTDLESLGRTPPASRHSNRSKQKAGGSSNEDLSDSTESTQKIQIRSRLRKFFAKRPPMEVLVRKGIYKDEPVFGRNLAEVCPPDPNNPNAPRVPPFVKLCVTNIESSDENMSTDGLYRASGNLSQVQKIRLDVDQNKLSVIEDNPDIHVLTGSLKLFFRELKEPLIPCSMFDRILAACSIKPREAKIKEFRDIVQSLPQCNRDTLKYLLEHLLRVTQYSERNRMHTANLAIVFGPTLLWAPAEQAHNIAIDCIQQNNVVDTLLTEFKEIFADDNKGRRKS